MSVHDRRWIQGSKNQIHLKDSSLPFVSAGTMGTTLLTHASHPRPLIGCFALLVAAFWPADGRASDAAFTDDGKLIYAIRWEDEETLDVINEDAGTLREVHVTLGDGAKEIVAITRAGAGRMYLLTHDAVWNWKVGEPSAALVEKAPEKTQFGDIACNPKTGEVLVTAVLSERDEDGSKHHLFYKPASDQPMVKVWLRHLPQAEICCPVYLPDGSVLFSAEEDLWHGMLEFNPGGPSWEPRGDLYAYRYAPIAQRETYPGTPDEIGVMAIAVSKKKVYVHMHRWHGSGWGHLARLNLPSANPKKNWTNGNTVRDSIRALRSVEELDDNPSISYLCASPDGRKVYYTDSGRPQRTHYMTRNDGEAEPFRAKAP
jgi:hypothetical protein